MTNLPGGIDVIVNPYLREDQAYLVPRQALSFAAASLPSTDKLVVGTRKLTEAEFAGEWVKWWVRREFFATGHLPRSIDVGLEPRRDDVSIYARLRARLAENEQ